MFKIKNDLHCLGTINLADKMRMDLISWLIFVMQMNCHSGLASSVYRVCVFVCVRGMALSVVVGSDLWAQAQTVESSWALEVHHNRKEDRGALFYQKEALVTKTLYETLFV